MVILSLSCRYPVVILSLSYRYPIVVFWSAHSRLSSFYRRLCVQPPTYLPGATVLRLYYDCTTTVLQLYYNAESFGTSASIHLNKVMKFTMCSVDHAICVSNTCRENLVLRSALPPEKISAIPNAMDPSKFTPDPSARYPTGTINVVIISRLVYRKGVDLVAPVVKVRRSFFGI